ncbi:hypothetical protein CA984_41665 [Streptosporangium minutum]|uniref:Glycosyltransferase RgtA/B/C/D-like domain-containing protein n=1 Tax=Streptosporangium minutum TaxID=569862 RepID=A0A243QI77_9ACTN|nr:hypothetical protein CA984_41665 [Streptosporangium minutum]
MTAWAGRSGLTARTALVAVVGTVAALLGIGVRARFGAHVAVDEPQYLLTALSIFEDFDLDITDELDDGRWMPWAGTEALPVQTEVLPGGTQISPHDPLLPILLAVPMGLGGWIAAKAVMALMAGALAALTLWTAVRRFAVPAGLATVGVILASAAAPLAVYGQQVYPELPAALATLAAVAVLTGPAFAGAAPPAGRPPTTAPEPVPGTAGAAAGPAGPLSGPAGRVVGPGPRAIAVFGLTVTALPWLSVKYAPVAAALALLGLWRLRAGRRPLLGLAAGFAVMGAVYLGVHRLVWGGWTVYASGDHFQESGEFGVMGFAPDYAGRAVRLVGLMVDRGYGLAAWQPAWLLLLPAAGFALRRLRPHGAVLLLPLAAGWLTATFVALTMHGYWWPGRQTVVVLPLAVLLILVLLAGRPGWLRWAGLGLGVAGLVDYAWLLADGYARRITWVSGFEQVGSPLHRLLGNLLPDYRLGWHGFWPLHLAWALASVLLIAYGTPYLMKGGADEDDSAPGRDDGGGGHPAPLR